MCVCVWTAYVHLGSDVRPAVMLPCLQAINNFRISQVSSIYDTTSIYARILTTTNTTKTTHTDIHTHTSLDTSHGKS